MTEPADTPSPEFISLWESEVVPMARREALRLGALVEHQFLPVDCILSVATRPMPRARGARRESHGS